MTSLLGRQANIMASLLRASEHSSSRIWQSKCQMRGLLVDPIGVARHCDHQYGVLPHRLALRTVLELVRKHLKNKKRVSKN